MFVVPESQPWYAIFQVAWLDPGRLIICAQERSLRPIQLWQVSYADGESKRITTDQLDYESVSVSGDGNKIVSVQRHRVGKVFVAPDGDALRAKPITSTVARRYGFDWTTNDKIVLSSMAGDNLNLSILDADGSQQTQVTANTGDNYTPATSLGHKGGVVIPCRGTNCSQQGVEIQGQGVNGNARFCKYPDLNG